MDVTAEVVGRETETVEFADGSTYAGLCRAAGYSPHEVTVLMDGRSRRTAP